MHANDNDLHELDGQGPGLRRMPGDPPRKEMLARMIRVNHTGKLAAMHLYQGQLAVLGRRNCAPTIRKMAEEERDHLKSFDRLLVNRRVRPSLLQPLWRSLGFAFGAGSALLGEKAAMACSAALEETVEAHYAQQADALGGDEPELRQLLEKQREDELSRFDVDHADGADNHPLYPVQTSSIKAGAKLAIWLSSRL